MSRIDRRAALQSGGALLAASGALALPRAVAGQGTPVAQEAGLLLLQGFGSGSLFPTQGDLGVPPYTLILWEAAAQGLFYTSPADGVAGFAPTESLLIAIAAGVRPWAAVMIPADAGRHVWALRLVNGELGADPGAVTYQGETFDEAKSAEWLGMIPETLPDGVQELGAGYLVIAGVPTIDLPETETVRITTG